MVEKHLAHQNELFHNYFDFKKVFHRVRHDGLWRVLKECSIDNRLIEVIILLYDEATSAAFLNGSVGDFFRTEHRKYHEQHTAFVLLVVGVVWKVNGRSATL